MTTYIVKAIFNGTTLQVPVSAKQPEMAARKASRKRLLRRASVLLVIERSTGETKHVQLNAQ